MLHQIPTTDNGTAGAVYLGRRLRAWADRAHTANLISSRQRNELEMCAAALDATAMETAICHLDYQPRNWLLGDDGRARILDFEHMRLDARLTAGPVRRHRSPHCSGPRPRAR
ncbi:hypothetical protein Pmi06nite_80710 [Planotetraspora mira]|uniref:Aminoglycoside phosphotransferase domain-containing protein n=1 Tax=Planotetraspora mira TaxID=58121 RepID=A0A8J3TY22_9ACTN|nr:hypothetical protein Pmi06nite_80710 [Planotetraspora mira]